MMTSENVRWWLMDGKPTLENFIEEHTVVLDPAEERAHATWWTLATLVASGVLAGVLGIIIVALGVSSQAW